LTYQRSRGPVRRQRHAVEHCDRAGCCELQPAFVNIDCPPAQAFKINQPAQLRLRLGKQPSPSREPGITGFPGRYIFRPPRPNKLRNSVQVHQFCRSNPVPTKGFACKIDANREVRRQAWLCASRRRLATCPVWAGWPPVCQVWRPMQSDRDALTNGRTAVEREKSTLDKGSPDHSCR
jgi:hypothetical protein